MARHEKMLERISCSKLQQGEKIVTSTCMGKPVTLAGSAAIKGQVRERIPAVLPVLSDLALVSWSYNSDEST